MLVAGLAGCSGEASHIPPLWQLPGAAISSAIGNAGYDAKRGRVKQMVTRNERAIAMEIDAGGGVRLTEAMRAARIDPAIYGTVLKELRDHPDIYRSGDGLKIEPVTVALMVHGN